MSRLLFEPFTIPYMQRALVEVLVLGALAGAVGVLVVLRRLAFVGDALTHTVFPGVVIAHLLGRSLLLGALAFGVLTAVLLTAVGRHRRVGDDAALAILLTSFFSLGVVLISRTRGFTADLTVFLFGRVLAIDQTDLAQTLAVAAVAALGRLRAGGAAVVMATHDLGLAHLACDEVCLLNRHQIGFGPIGTTLTPELLRATYGGQALQLRGDGVIVARP